MLTHFSLFTGIGGIDLSAEWAGFTTVGQCEWADYPTKVLEKHWPYVPKWRDIRSVTAESFYEKIGLRTIDLITGGDPCQPHSLAGNRLKEPRGKEDERYFWPEMYRIIRELQPDWVINENVAGSVSNGITDEKIFDLEKAGYQVQSFLIPACSVGALFRGYRVFIIAKTKRNEYGEPRKEKSCSGQIGRMGRFFKSIPWNRDWQSALCEFRRMDDGLSYRVDRLDTIRNAVNPYQIYPILQAIADIERSCHE